MLRSADRRADCFSCFVTLFCNVVYVVGKVRSAGTGSVTPRVRARVTSVLPRPSPRQSRPRASLSQRSPPVASRTLSEAARVFTARATLYY